MNKTWQAVVGLLALVLVVLAAPRLFLLFNLSREQGVVLFGMIALSFAAIVRRHYVLFTGVVVLGLILFLVSYNRYYDLGCLIGDEFPEAYNLSEVIIYSSRFGGPDYYGNRTIIVYGNGSAYYIGYRGSSKPKACSGVLPQERIDEIIKLLREKRFFCLKEEYAPLLYTENLSINYVSFTTTGATKRVRDYGASSPSSFGEITRELDDSVKDLPQIRQEETDEFCHVIMEELDRMHVGTEYWMGGCRGVVNASLH